MKLKRRTFAVLLALTAVLAAFLPARSADKRGSRKNYLMLVGTYTSKTESKGIYAFNYDAATGILTARGIAAKTPNPSWIVVHPSGQFAYAANESGKASMVSAFALDATNAKLTPLNQLPALGEDPCYLSFDKTGKFLLVANYSSGNVAIFPILPDGRLGEHTAVMKDEGATGPNKERQEAPHAHWIETTAGNRFAYVTDLGLDRVLIYKFDAAKGSLTAGAAAPANGADPFSATLNPGTGPRHVAFGAGGKFMYVLGELQSTVTVFANESNETYRNIQEISMLPKGFSGRNDAAEIEIRPDGKFLYASNRGHDSIAVYSIDQNSGKLTQVADVPTGGKEPRHFAIAPDGKFMLVENQHSNNIIVFYVDAATGIVRQTGQTIEVPSPVNVTFVPVE